MTYRTADCDIGIKEYVIHRDFFLSHHLKIEIEKRHLSKESVAPQTDLRFFFPTSLCKINR